jgi:hypothetical protein
MSVLKEGIHCESGLVLKDFLLPNETIKYQSPNKLSYLGDKFYFYITNQRILAYRSKGKYFKKDRIVAEKLEAITSLSYNEKGLMRKKALLNVQTESKRMFFEGKIPDVKGIWQELQKYTEKDVTTVKKKESKIKTSNIRNYVKK